MATDLKSMLIRDEGRVSYAYQDSLGYWTVGVGHQIDKRKGGYIPDFIIDMLLDYDIQTKTGELLRLFPWVDSLDEPRKSVIIAMAFQIGVDGLAKFVKALGFMRAQEYTQAALAFADSKVAREQTPERWKRYCNQIRVGAFQ